MEAARIIRAALKKQGAPEDLVLCAREAEHSARAGAHVELRPHDCDGRPCDGEGGLFSGKPAYGVGAGNATVIVDETADVAEAALNTRLSKMQNYGSGCSCDGNLVVEATVYDAFSRRSRRKAAISLNAEEKKKLEAAMWDAEGHRTIDTVARPAHVIAQKAGFALPEGKQFLIVKEDKIGKEHKFSSEKLSVVLAVFKFSGFENALKMISAIFEVGGKGHSCGINSKNDDHIHRLAVMAPVSRIMVRQPNVSGNAGSFTNGMPMTASLGCGTWGGNIVSENISVKHYMNTTWVSRPIPEDKPSEQELLGEFFNSEVF